MLLCLGAISWQSCQYNACKSRGVECSNGGVCDLGDCKCVLGWEGEKCEIPVNGKFASHYVMVKTQLNNGTLPTVDDDDTLYMTANLEKRNIVYFHSIRDSVILFEGHVRENALTIPEQTILSNTYTGEGSLNGEKLTITVRREDNNSASFSQTTWVGKQYETF